MSLLDIKNLRVRFGSFLPVKNASMHINAGELVALVGSSGSGKSTLAMSILRLIDESTVQGKVMFGGKNLVYLTEDKLRQIRGKKIAMIFQEPMTSLNPLHTVAQQISEVLKMTGQSTSKKIVLSLLEQVELIDTERIYKSYPHELSGGQRQRVMIAMALAGNPELLIADEPTTALDVTVQAQILDLLKRLQQKLNLAILFITHDLDVVRRIADRVYVMQHGKIVSMTLPSVAQPWIRHTPKQLKRDLAIEVENLNVYYHRFHAVQDVSFCVQPGRTIGIVGESGSGKSSLAQGLMRLIEAQGRVLINGSDFFALSGKKLREARSYIQMVLQDPASSLNPRMMVGDIIGEGLKVRKEKDIDKKVFEILKLVDLSSDIIHRYPHELSGGQRTRVALARALILKPSVLVLDEVTSSLDVRTQRQLVKLLTSLQKELNLAYIFISHDMKVIRSLSDDILVMKDGRIIEYDFAGKLFRKPKNIYTKRLLRDSFIKL
ncbi:MAG: ABC transporter ATP-binding protein [Alphaproteobacteria bacterium]|nr:ABC transporter ATP-binding protein [Alphaproteobacteria bacterium]